MCDDQAMTKKSGVVDAATDPEVAVTKDNPPFEDTLIQACVTALWADGSMARSERNTLDNLIVTIARTKRDQDRLRRLAMEEPNRQQVLDDVSRLDPIERLDLFDRCLGMVMSDGRLGRKEGRFLKNLRSRCGVGFMRYQRLVSRHIPSYRKILIAVFAAVVIGGAVGLRFYQPPDLLPADMVGDPAVPETAPPDHASIHPELLLPPPGDELPELESEQLYEAVRRSVVTVIVRLDEQRLASGSGAVIAIDAGRNHYFVITNRHVIMHETTPEKQLTFEVEFENQARFDAVLDFYSKRHDLALLAVLGTPLWAQPVAMRPSAGLTIGEQVYAVGSPMGLRHTFTSGIISALRDGMIQTDATVHSGSSGGPLFDSRGLLCGVVTSTHMTKDFSFALYADAVLDMLAERSEASM